MNWKQYLPTKHEQGDWTGFLSIYAEWHALGIGLGIGAVGALLGSPEILLSVVMIAIGEAQAQGDQMKDVASEPVYALVGLVVGYLAVGFGVNPQAIQKLADLLTAVGGFV